MEKGYPKVVWLFVFVCVQKGGRAAPEPAGPAPPAARPDWPPPAAGRPAREHTRAGGAGPTGPLEGRPTPDPSTLPRARAALPFPVTFQPAPLPSPSGFSARSGPGAYKSPRERVPPGHLLNSAN